MRPLPASRGASIWLSLRWVRAKVRFAGWRVRECVSVGIRETCQASRGCLREEGGGEGSHLELRAAHSTRLAHVDGEGAANSARTRLNASSCCATTRRAASGGVAQSFAGAAAAVCVGASECIPTRSTTCKLASWLVVSFCVYIYHTACVPVAIQN